MDVGFLIATFLLFLINVDGKGSTLNTGEVLQTNETLNSSNGRFQLGFFSVTNSNNQYLGIWYTDPNKTVVWVANGDHPIISGSGMLSLSPDGTLLLRDTTDQEVWSTGSQHSRGEPQACLLDSGLLVVNDTKQGKLLWQSLYQLSDTLLPYVPLGYTKLLDSMLEIQLSSWNTTGVDPSTGQYVRKLDPSRRYELVAFKGPDITYRSGPWDGKRWNGFPIMKQDLLKFFVSKTGSDGAYFWYEPQNPSDLWRQVINSNGTTYRYYLKGSEWIEYWKAPSDSTPSYAACGPYGIYFDGNCKCCVESLFHPKNETDWKNRKFSGGCERNFPLNDTHNGFATLKNVKLPDTINAISDESKSKSECASWCLKNSSCTAYAYMEWQGCLTWFGDIIDMEKFQDGGDGLYIRVASSNDSNNRKIVFIAVPISIAAVLVLLTVVIRVRKTIIFSGNSSSLRLPFRRTTEAAVQNSPSSGHEDVQIFEFFDFRTIITATGDFNDKKIIGKGQLGPVYKGVLENGEEIAVKRLSGSARTGNEQLKNELNLLAKLKHKNLVKLTGFCIQQQETILCFEFMQNHSLDQLLFGTRQEASELNWEQRFKLIQGVSSGLLYLHEDNGDIIIHRDVKPANILLDKNMVPKISDFGLARFFVENCSFLMTATISGTRGYMAPELQSGMLSTKADVYSFGMVTLEIISGQRNMSSSFGLVSLALQYLNEGRLLEFKDARLREPWSDEEIKRCIHIALLCLLEEPQTRPNMRQINLWLCSQLIPLTTLPAEASYWGNIAIDPSTSVDSTDLL